VWLPTSRRETTARHLLTRAWRELDDPRSVPVATAAAELLNPEADHPSPADEVWLPLDAAAGGSRRRALSSLLAAWPHVSPPVATSSEAALASDSMSPPPSPMPPATAPRGASQPGKW
jgi:hypothetical protein